MIAIFLVTCLPDCRLSSMQLFLNFDSLRVSCADCAAKLV
jgi:hypothetical protein